MNEDLKQKVEMAIKRLQGFAPKEGKYYLAFSGGKDSVTIKALADMAGVPYEAHYRVTSVDPPELVAFIRDYHPDVAREIPRDKDGKPITMWNIIPKKRYPPTRLMRYCCEKLKEDAGDGKKTITGVRWEESANRKMNHGLVTFKKTSRNKEVADNENFKQVPRGGYILTNDNEEARRVVESCYKRSKLLVNPIIDWTDKDVWEFIHEYKIPYCSLYDDGFARLGCIGCPMGGTNGRIREFNRWPKYERLYKLAFEKLVEIYKSPEYKGKAPWRDVQSLWNWWMEIEIPTGQIGFDEILEEEDEK